MADDGTFQGQNHGLAQAYGEDGEPVTPHDEDDFLSLFDREVGFGSLKQGAQRVGNHPRTVHPSMEAFFGPGGVAEFFRQFLGEMKGMRTLPDASDEDDDPEFLRNKKRPEAWYRFISKTSPKMVDSNWNITRFLLENSRCV